MAADPNHPDFYKKTSADTKLPDAYQIGSLEHLAGPLENAKIKTLRECYRQRDTHEEALEKFSVGERVLVTDYPRESFIGYIEKIERGNFTIQVNSKGEIINIPAFRKWYIKKLPSAENDKIILPIFNKYAECVRNSLPRLNILNTVKDRFAKEAAANFNKVSASFNASLGGYTKKRRSMRKTKKQGKRKT